MIEFIIDLISDFISIWSGIKEMKGGQNKIPLFISILMVVLFMLILIKI